MEFDFELESEQGEQLFQLVLRADSLARTTHETTGFEAPVTSIELTTTDAEQHTATAVEALFGVQDGRRILAQLDVRVHIPMKVSHLEAVAREVCARFGGSDMTSLALGRRQGERVVELCDLTVTFPSRLPFWARNVALLSDIESEPDARSCAAALRALGVHTRLRGRSLTVPTWQVRTKPLATDQAAALASGIDKMDAISLYTAPLPATRSTVVAACRNGTVDDVLVDLCLSRGLARQEAVGSGHCSEIENYLEQRAIRFDGRTWHARAMLAEGDSDGGHAVIERKPVQWSINWGVRR